LKHAAVCFLLFLSALCYGQKQLLEDSTSVSLIADTSQTATLTNTDSLPPKPKGKRHSPLRASLYSLALPGLGQAYNKKYWKIPIVYAGFGGLGYALYHTGTNFYGYRNAYRIQADEDTATVASFKGVSNKATLKSYRDYFKKNLDITAICTGVWYVLTIVDAAVDAHLFEWNMKDDIHLSWQPTMIGGSANLSQSTLGLRVGLTF
jgi:hypothetical protein